MGNPDYRRSIHSYTVVDASVGRHSKIQVSLSTKPSDALISRTKLFKDVLEITDLQKFRSAAAVPLNAKNDYPLPHPRH